MMEKMPILIFRPEIPYSEPISVVFFLFKYFFLFQKILKNCNGGHRHNMTKIKATSRRSLGFFKFKYVRGRY